jgi:hypothetical protein
MSDEGFPIHTMQEYFDFYRPDNWTPIEVEKAMCALGPGKPRSRRGQTLFSVSY